MLYLYESRIPTRAYNVAHIPESHSPYGSGHGCAEAVPTDDTLMRAHRLELPYGFNPRSVPAAPGAPGRP